MEPEQNHSTLSDEPSLLLERYPSLAEDPVFCEFRESIGWTYLRGTRWEIPAFEKWKQMTEQAKREQVLIDSYCVRLKERIEGDKEAANLEWKDWLLDGYVVLAVNQKPPIPWKSPEQPWNMVARLCSEVYGVEVRPVV